MRVLVVTNDFPTSFQPNLGIFILRQLQALREHGHEFAVARVVPRAFPLNERWRNYVNTPSEYEFEGVPVVSIRAFYPPRMIGLEFLREQVAGRVEKAIQRFVPALIHANYVIPGGIYAIGYGVPTVLTAHGSDAYDWPWRRVGLERAARRVVAASDSVVAVSNFVKSCVERLGGRNVEVVPNGADEAIFSPVDRAAARAALGIGRDRRLIAYVGALIPTKGVIELARAAARLRDLSPIVAVAGAGPELGAMRRILGDAGVDFHYLGTVEQRTIAQMFGAADAVTLPSYEEGLPASICEAMLMGRAVVATPVGGIPEVIEDGVTGLIVPPRDDAALAAALRKVITEDALRETLESAARSFAAGRLTWRANAAQYDRIYRETAARTPTGSSVRNR